jgi:23S rRNA G2069 N7-methylase RlmK/C1962 C5-methylase RlmI
VQADVLQYLRETRPVFDLVVLDPPSFSNSKRMEGVLDLQRHHVDLIDRCVNLLSPQGALMFSTNLRDFRLDAPLLSRWKIAELNRIPADFRNRRIHRSWWLSP